MLVRFLGPDWKESDLVKKAIRVEGEVLVHCSRSGLFPIPKVNKAKRTRIRKPGIFGQLLESAVHAPCHPLHSVVDVVDLDLQAD